MQSTANKYKFTLSLVSFVRTVFSFVELVLLVRIILDFLKASHEAIFMQFVVRITDPLIWPFLGTFSPYELDGGFVIQFHEILALVVYAFIGYLIVQGITILGSHKSLWSKGKTKEDYR